MNGPLLYRRGTADALDVSGRDRIAFLQGLTTNDFRTLSAGAIWGAALSPVGKVLFVFRAAIRGDRIRLLLSPGAAGRAAAHLRKYAVFQDVRIEEAPPLLRFDLYGAEPPPPPSAVEAWPPFFELRGTWLVAAGEAEAVEAVLAASGASVIGDEEAEARRIEAGRPEEGKEIDETRTPDEAGLSGAVSTTKGCYVGQEIVARMRTYGRAPRRLVRFVFDGAGPVPAGTRLVRAAEPDPEAGRVTSSAISAGGLVALGYVGRGVADGETLSIAGDPGRAARVEPISP